MSLRSVIAGDHINSGDKMITAPAVTLTRAGSSDRAAEATIVIGAESTNVRTITIQLFKEGGLIDCDSVQTFLMVVFSSAAMTPG